MSTLLSEEFSGRTILLLAVFYNILTFFLSVGVFNEYLSNNTPMIPVIVILIVLALIIVLIQIFLQKHSLRREMFNEFLARFSLHIYVILPCIIGALVPKTPIPYFITLVVWIILTLILLITKKSGPDISFETLKESDQAFDLAKKYTQVRIQTLKKDVEKLTAHNIDKKVKAALKTDINKFMELLLLNNIQVTSTKTLIDYILDVTEPIRNDLRDALREHLSKQLLVAEEERPVVELDDMIDNLLTDFMKMEATGSGKPS